MHEHSVFFGLFFLNFISLIFWLMTQIFNQHLLFRINRLGAVRFHRNLLAERFLRLVTELPLSCAANNLSFCYTFRDDCSLSHGRQRTIQSQKRTFDFNVAEGTAVAQTVPRSSPHPLAYEITRTKNNLGYQLKLAKGKSTLKEAPI